METLEKVDGGIRVEICQKWLPRFRNGIISLKGSRMANVDWLGFCIASVAVVLAPGRARCLWQMTAAAARAGQDCWPCLALW